MNAVLQWRNRLADDKLDGRYMYIPVTISFVWIILVLSVFVTANAPFHLQNPDRTRLDRLHPINKGNKPTTSVRRSGFSMKLCPHHFNPVKREGTSNRRSPASFGFASLGGHYEWKNEGFLPFRFPLISIFVKGMLS